MTKKNFTFILLLFGMFSFSNVSAQIICDCVPGQPMGYCYIANNGHTKCKHVKFGSGWRVANQITEEASVTISPNPVFNSAIISFFIEYAQNVSLQIFDMNGRLVLTIADRVFTDVKNDVVWNTENVNAGIYCLLVQSAENQERLKLVVTK